MRLPEMKYTDRIRKSKQIKFGGLNHTAGAKDGELFAMRNLTSDHAPVMATRARRLKYGKLQEPGGLFSWEKLCWVDGTAFYFGGAEKAQVTAGQKTFASIGSWIVILPDKCCYNVDTGELRSIESKWAGNKLEFSDGTLNGIETKANTIVNADGGDWAEWFNAGDTVSISGCTGNPANNKHITIREVDGDQLRFYENSFTLGDTDDYTEEGALRIERCMPDIKHICENENRLWGCSDNRIFACKLGDPFNWETRDGLDTDGWDVDTGSAGVFTGCISYGGYPIFFKEDHIYKVYGSIPSNFEMMGAATLGLAKGCSRSLAVAGETLFYMSVNGVMAYTGGVPQPMGEAFGLQRFKNAAAGSDGLKYYISMENAEGGWELYVYDTQRGLWHREDELQVSHFVRHDGNLYMLDAPGNIWIGGNPQGQPEGTEPEEILEWMAEFSDFTEEDPNKKGITKLQLRLELEAGASVQVWMQFDGDGQWQKVGSALSENVKRSYYLPIIPRRADHYRLKLTGSGGCRLYSLVREYYIGSENRSTTGRN